MTQILRTIYPAVFVSVFFALVLSIIPLPPILGYFRPPFVALVILFWALNFSEHSGMGMAFIVGLIFDQLMGVTLGQYAFAFVLVAALMNTISISMRLFTLWQQMVVILGFLLLYECVVMLIQGLCGYGVNFMWAWLPAITGALCWPLVVFMLRNNCLKQKL